MSRLTGRVPRADRSFSFVKRLFSPLSRVTRMSAPPVTQRALKRSDSTSNCLATLEKLEERELLSAFFVSLSGDDSNAGTAAAPFRTIQKAIAETAAADAAADTINVEAGTYDDPTKDTEISIPNSANINDLQLIGGWDAGSNFTTRTPRSTIYVPQQAGNVVAADVDVFADNVTIDGFHWVFDGTQGISGARQSAGIFSRGDTFTLNDNLIEVGSSSAVGVFDAYGFQTIFGNLNNGTLTLTRNEFQADALHASGAIYINPGAATAVNIGGAGALGNTVSGSNLSQGIVADTISDVTIQGNTITRTGPIADVGFHQLIFAGPFNGAANQTNVTISDNILEGGRSDGVTNDVGIEIGNTSGNGLTITMVSVTANNVQDNRIGILITPESSNVTIDNNTMGLNAAGLAIASGVAAAPTITNNSFAGNVNYHLRDVAEVLGGATVYDIFSGIGGNKFDTATVVTNGAGVVQSTTSLNIRPTIQQSIDDASNGDFVEVSNDTINNVAGIYDDAVNVNKQLAALHFIGEAEIGGPVTLSEDLLITSEPGVNLTFTSSGTIDGNQHLIVNVRGTTTFNGRIGDITPLATLTTDSVTVSGETRIGTDVINVQGDAIIFNDPVILDGNTTLTSSTGSITLGNSVTGAFALTVHAGANVSLGTVHIDGVLIVDVDSDANGSNTLTADSLSASTVTISGTGIDETLTFNGTVTATADGVTIENALTADLNGNVTAATNLTIQHVGTVNLAQDVDLQATNGNVAVSTGVTSIDLRGAAGTNVVTAAGALNLAPVVDSGTPTAFEVNSGTAMTLASVDIANLLDLNLDTGADDTTTLTAGNLQAGTITVDGQGTNDTLQFNGTVTATTASISVNQADQVNFTQDVTAVTHLTISNVNTEVDLAASVDLTATAGDVAVSSGVTAIDLSGAAGANVITAAGSVNLAAVADSGTPAEFEVSSGTDITLASVNIANLLDVNLDTGANDITTLNAGNLQAGTITVDGQGVNDTFQFNGTVTATSASISVNQADQVNFTQDVTAATDLTISNVNTEVDLAASVDLRATTGDVAASAGVTAIDLSGADGINLVSAGGSVDLAAVADSGTPAEFEVNSGTNMTLASVNIANLLDLNLDTGADDSATLTAGNLQAGTITADGQGANDTMQFSGTVTSTTASITVSQASLVNFAQDVTAETLLTVQNATQVDLGGNADLRTNNGSLSVASGVGSINLSGGAATSNLVDGNGDALVALAPITASGAPAALTINSQAGVDLASISIPNTDLNIASDDDEDTTVPVLIDQNITARQLTITVNEDNSSGAAGSDLTITSSVTAMGGDTTLNAGDRVIVGASAQVQSATGDVRIKGGFGGDTDGNGTVITIEGTVTASSSVSALGDANSDLFVITKTNTSDPFAIDCLGGADTVFVRPQDLPNAGTCESIFSAPGSTASVQSVNIPGGTLDVTTLGLDPAILNAGLFIIGNTGNETIVGGPGPDTVFGLVGDDSIRGGGGEDKIFGEEGNDDLDGEEGDDFLEGFEGNDTLRGGQGNDTLLDLTDGNDSLLGGADDDTLVGGPGDDTQQGNDGDDLLLDSALFIFNVEILTTDPAVIGYTQGGGNDEMDGGQGNDTLNGGAGNDELDGGDGNDLVVDVHAQFRVARATGANDDTLDQFHIRVNGGSMDVLGDPVGGNDKKRRTQPVRAIPRPDLAGFDANKNDTIRGGSGNDTLAGGSGADSIEGGSGDDVLMGSILADDHVYATTRTRDLDGLLGGNIDAGVFDGDDTLVGDAGADILIDFSGQKKRLNRQDKHDIVIDSFARKSFNLLFSRREQIMGTSVRAVDLSPSDIQQFKLSDPNGGILGNALSEIFVKKNADGSLDRDGQGKLIQKGSLGAFLQKTVGIGPLAKTKAGRIDIDPETVNIGIKVPNAAALDSLRDKLRGSD